MRKATYQDAGVDIDAGARAVELMKEAVRSTHGAAVVRGLSDFGGMIGLGAPYHDPVLVGGTDSVGTKLKIAFLLDRHDTVGQDCVAMCVDDVACQGATPLLFLDYLGIGKLIPEKVADIVKGVAEGCRLAGCALLGGETAELPGLYAQGEYDLVGFAVGVVERARIIDGSAVAAGDLVVGLPSSGLHSNGYSLVRYVLLEQQKMDLAAELPELGRALGEELLEPTRIYAGSLARLFRDGPAPHAIAHITGGGIAGNLGRVIPPGAKAVVKRGSWPRQPVFAWLQGLGKLTTEEMERVFNCGLGLIACVPEVHAEALVSDLAAAGEFAYVVGEVVSAEGGPRAVVVE